MFFCNNILILDIKVRLTIGLFLCLFQIYFKDVLRRIAYGSGRTVIKISRSAYFILINDNKDNKSLTNQTEKQAFTTLQKIISN